MFETTGSTGRFEHLSGAATILRPLTSARNYAKLSLPKKQIRMGCFNRTIIPKKSHAKNNTNLDFLSWFVLFWSGAVEGTRTLTVSHRNLNPARMPISPRLQAQLLYHKAGICKAFAASAQKNQKQCKNGCFFSDYLLYCYSLAGVTQW